MPLKRDVGGGGTNQDGSKSDRFCSYCYQQGQYTHPHLTLPEMTQLIKTKLRSAGIPGIFTGLFTRNLIKLERWKP
jgi:hypothetical protein